MPTCQSRPAAPPCPQGRRRRCPAASGGGTATAPADQSSHSLPAAPPTASPAMCIKMASASCQLHPFLLHLTCCIIVRGSHHGQTLVELWCGNMPQDAPQGCNRFRWPSNGDTQNNEALSVHAAKLLKSLTCTRMRSAGRATDEDHRQHSRRLVLHTLERPIVPRKATSILS